MRKNFYAVLCVSALFGFTFGMYDLVLPFYLQERGISDLGQGYIFAAGFLIPFFLRIGVGSVSDRMGRKIFYSLSILMAGTASLLTPLAASAVMQATIKGMRESAVEIRRVLHPILLYESAKKNFVDFIGKTQGMEKLLEAAGYPAAGFLMAAGGASGYRNALFLAALLLGLGFIAFTALYSEPNFPSRGDAERSRAVSLREMVSFKLNKKLWIIIGSSMIFNVGLACSHCFVMQLFFTRKFGLTEDQTSWVLMLHRVFMAISLILAGRIIRGGVRAQKFYYIAFIFLEGAFIAVSGVIPDFRWATGIWLIHDLFGAGLWLPAQSALIMHYSNEQIRGAEVGKVLAFSSATLFLGPLLAGYLAALPGVSASMAISLPFIAGGGIIAVSALFLLAL